MQNNVGAAREISEARTAAYSATLWAEVPVVHGSHGAYVTFHDIVRAAIVGRRGALSAISGDLGRFPPSDFDRVAVAILTAWFLDFGYFRFSLQQVPVAVLFGLEPVAVTEEMAGRLSVAAARFLCGYDEQDPDKRIAVVPFAALAIKEAMWGGPLPEEWIA